ncbi:hypothetical protein L21SP5_00951 [Salinivirga cyanobacteriivorans]|uniref:Glycosyltransferase RgtA/B/C/D-like domain-containing protein n=1 Tax=Salinivirga cyanobacteriivorans TaxID=1307839 RepID=A0A0S2HX30_9BACT|nr:hypothetical protein [Salinivirga cyanobacteriivorans]ALO14618.1 hypothetical protein L21SP5_00951 [Salinivirga cyanobacteriivorans]
MKKHTPTIIIILLFIVIAIIYNYHNIVFKKPQSVHKWRQSDCASITLNYYQDGMDFFEPETHNLTSDQGTTGKCSTSEMPLLYYTVAGMYHVFGYHDFIYRIFNTLIFFLGLFYLFKLSNYLLRNTFWSAAIVLLFFTSPVLAYYGNNYLTNTTALAVSFIGWYQFIRYIFEKKKQLLIKALILFFLAASLKITALFSLFAIVGVFIFDHIPFLKGTNKAKNIQHPILFVIGSIAAGGVVAGWAAYARYYNELHNCTYFSTTIFPIWNYDSEGINHILSKVRKLWLYQYYHASMHAFLTLAAVFIIAFYKKNLRVFNLAILFILIEIVIFVLLQFMTFADHDYYTIGMFILPALILLSSILVFKKRFPKLFNHVIFKTAIALLIGFNVYYAHTQVTERYEGWYNKTRYKQDIYSIQPYLDSIGVTQNDTIISIPDGSNASLYIMNRKGWTQYTDARFNRGEKIRYNQDSAGIAKSIKNGARYMIVQGIEQLYLQPFIQPFATELVGKYKRVLIFDLKQDQPNFDASKRIVSYRYFTNAEYLTINKKQFLNPTDSTLYANGQTQSNDASYSGNYSIKLNAGNPYGATITIDSISTGESFSISAWRKNNEKDKGCIVASSTPEKFYKKGTRVVDTTANGWEKIQLEFFIPENINGQELKIYLYNPNEKSVFFDDFEIIRYKSVFRLFEIKEK